MTSDGATATAGATPADTATGFLRAVIDTDRNGVSRYLAGDQLDSTWASGEGVDAWLQARIATRSDPRAWREATTGFTPPERADQVESSTPRPDCRDALLRHRRHPGGDAGRRGVDRGGGAGAQPATTTDVDLKVIGLHGDPVRVTAFHHSGRPTMYWRLAGELRPGLDLDLIAVSGGPAAPGAVEPPPAPITNEVADARRVPGAPPVTAFGRSRNAYLP